MSFKSTRTTRTTAIYEMSSSQARRVSRSAYGLGLQAACGVGVSYDAYSMDQVNSALYCLSPQRASHRGNGDNPSDSDDPSDSDSDTLVGHAFAISADL